MESNLGMVGLLCELISVEDEDDRILKSILRMLTNLPDTVKEFLEVPHLPVMSIECTLTIAASSCRSSPVLSHAP